MPAIVLLGAQCGGAATEPLNETSSHQGVLSLLYSKPTKKV